MNIPFDPSSTPSPAYVVDVGLLQKNLQILSALSKETGARILLAQKAFSMFSLYPLIGRYLSGGAASGLFEARLAKEHLPGEVHTYSPAFNPADFDKIAALSDHIIFNSIGQWERFGEKALTAGCSCGIRINPQYSTQDHAIYDPCAPGSRLGATCESLPDRLPNGIEGMHFHTLCEQGFEPLARTFEVVEQQFSSQLKTATWLNLGGGHHITRKDYDRKALADFIKYLQDQYDLTIYLEPGEAVALNTGFLVCTVLDIQTNGQIQNAILDTSAACHMPDVIEMPYRPPLVGAGNPGEKAYTYRLGGGTCLSGDVIGDYSFDKPLFSGQRLCFSDMAIYTMVKNNTFNGMPLPDIFISNLDASLTPIRSFDYSDFKNRLS